MSRQMVGIKYSNSATIPLLCLSLSYNKTKEMPYFLKFIFGMELYMFRTAFVSIIRSLVLYTQQ